MLNDLEHIKPNVEENIRFTDIFTTNEIQRMQELFTNATGVASLITYIDGTPISHVSSFCQLCNLFNTTESGNAYCKKADVYFGSFDPKGIVIKQCLNFGLWDANIEIKINGKHVANWLLGQVRSESVDLLRIINYAEEAGIDRSKYQDALKNIPLMSLERFKDVVRMLDTFVNQVCEEGYQNYLLKKNIEEKKETNKFLSEREEYISLLLDSIGDAVVSTDRTGNIVSMNSVAESITGWSITEAFGKPFNDIFKLTNSKTNLPIVLPIEQVLITGKIINLGSETELLTKSGQKIHISDSAAPIKNKLGSICGAVLVFTDVTQKYNVEETARESEVKYRNLINHLNSGIVVHSTDTSIMLNNPRASELLGLSTEQMQGLKAIDPEWKFVDENENPLPLDMYPVNRIIQSKRPFKDQISGICCTKEGEITWVNINGFPVFDSSNDLTQVIISFDDITSQKKNADKLKEDEKFLSQTQLIAKLGTYSIDVKHGMIESSVMLDEILGLDSGHSNLAAEYISIIHPDWKKEVIQYFSKEIVLDKKSCDIEFKIIRKNDSSERWVHALGELIFDRNGRISKMIGTIQDITLQKSAKDNLKESQDELKKFAAHLQNVREEERIMLAREIHDDLAQILIAMKIDLGLLKQNMLSIVDSKNYSDVKTQFDDLTEIVNNTVISARRIMTDLRPEVLDMVGFTDTVKQHLNHFQQRHKIKCIFENQTPELILNPDQSVALFRIVQEALNNVAKHAKASQAQVLLQQFEDKLLLKIEDDGIGFEQDEQKSADTFGLIGIRERVSLLEGELKINSTKGVGTSITITMPYSNDLINNNLQNETEK